MKTKLRELRKNANLTQEQLAKLANVHRTVIARCEEGVNLPSYKTLCKISRALNVSLDELIKEGA